MTCSLSDRADWDFGSLGVSELSYSLGFRAFGACFECLEKSLTVLCLTEISFENNLLAAMVHGPPCCALRPPHMEGPMLLDSSRCFVVRCLKARHAVRGNAGMLSSS